ncbi:hypothetical protein OJF2_68970 [Aquisphaera giovannonii]|uniref:Cytochrome c domain-containing protein n=1 Tax=Aquisphaera giovannonii TaxID=406548 RepID=A0A5B9WDJ4_9BACT|nr:hypothetical protein [Aquisphaera giovannonii]QEH38299.1 hypothetical protein OJF2_68970 [Aquisphaera giovannonii]
MLKFSRNTTLAFVAASALGLGACARAAVDDEPAASPPGKSDRIALLVDGQVVKGAVREEGRTVIVSQPVGSKKFPKKRVEKVFDSMEQVYAYKVEQLPAEDFDERIKLARWCLLHKLQPQAREQLQAILDQSADHRVAKAMITALDQEQARLALAGKQDPELQQAGAEQVQPQGDGAAAARPGTLDPSVIAGARRGMGVSDLPVVFDLPQAQAVRVAEEFKRYVHPVLQASCARCHNERYEGTFQLVQFKTKLDRTPEALRANLDATLKLIDQENPARSELLSSTLRAHGRGPNPRPIFQGSNDTSYRILATWANKLQARPARDASAPARPASPGGESDETFASQRGRIAAGPSSITGPTSRPFPTGPVINKSTPPVRAVPGRGMVVDNSNDPAEFPVPFAVSGARPPASPATKPALAGRPRAATPPAKPAPAAASPADDGVVPASAPADAAGDDTGDEPPLPEPGKKPKKPVKLDPGLLQKALQLRNQGRASD